MASALSVLVLRDSLAQPLQLSGLSFVIVSSLKFVFFRRFAEAKARSWGVRLKL